RDSSVTGVQTCALPILVTNPIAGCRNNKWWPVLERHDVPFIPLPDVEWTVYKFQSPLLKLNAIFPEGIEIPAMYVGKNVCHAPKIGRASCRERVKIEVE